MGEGGLFSIATGLATKGYGQWNELIQKKGVVGYLRQTDDVIGEIYCVRMRCKVDIRLLLWFM